MTSSNSVKTCLQICLSFIVSTCNLPSKAFTFIKSHFQNLPIFENSLMFRRIFMSRHFLIKLPKREILDFLLDLICIVLSSGRGDNRTNKEICLSLSTTIIISKQSLWFCQTNVLALTSNYFFHCSYIWSKQFMFVFVYSNHNLKTISPFSMVL